MARRDDCEICCGGGRVRLAVHKQATAAAFGDLASALVIEDQVRSYPCPECSEIITEDRVAIINTVTLAEMERYSTRADAFMREVKLHAAATLLHKIQKDGDFIHFEEGRGDGWRIPIKASIGVVSPKQVASIEERAAVHQEHLALEVMAEADMQINNWGAYFGHSEILKRDARRLIQEALKTVLERRAQKAKEPA